MKSSRFKKVFAVVLSLAISVSTLIGCGSSNSANTSASNSEGGQVLTYNLAADPKTLDPGLNNSVDGSIVAANLFEGLCKKDENDKAIPGMAEKWDISDDQLTYTFHLRSDIKWSNGDPVTAQDFEYSWKRVADPNTAAEYASQMAYIKGAEDFTLNGGSSDNMAVKAIDDKTLEVTLAAPCPYFLELTAFTAYFPVNKKVVESDPNWANSVDNYVCNGPFKLTKYAMKDELVLERNENYYDKDKVKLDKLVMKEVVEPTSAWASFTSDQFDMIDIVPKSEIEKGVADGSVILYPNLGSYYWVFNLSDTLDGSQPEVAKALKNPLVRQALALAVDRESIVKNITKGGEVPATGIVPTGLYDADGNEFKKEYVSTKPDYEKAKQLLAEAGYPNGEGFPTLVFLTNPENDAHTMIAQAIQDMWKTNLGINMEIQTQEWKVFQTTRQTQQFQIARFGWSADYADPMTFLDINVSTGGNNDGKYNDPAYDEAIKAAKTETDSAKRFEEMRKAEDLYLGKDWAAIPIYYYTQPKAVKSWVKDVYVSPLGDIHFDRAYIEK